MKRENAEKIAAAESEVDLAKARAAIKAFLVSVAECPVCEGSAEFKYRGNVKVPVRGMRNSAEMEDVAVGESGSCPNCGPEGKGDPDWVIWHCLDGYSRCQPGTANQSVDHEKCGWIIALPWE